MYNLYGRRRYEASITQCVSNAVAGCRGSISWVWISDIKEAVTEAIRDWMQTLKPPLYYRVGLRPHPYPTIVRDFQRVIGVETKKQIRKKKKLHRIILSCVGGGSNAIGIFHPFIQDKGVRLIAVEAGGRSHVLGDHAASLHSGQPGVLHGAYSYLLQTEEGQVSDAHSISAGLDYPGVSPELSNLKDKGRIDVISVTDHDAFLACQRFLGRKVLFLR